MRTLCYTLAVFLFAYAVAQSTLMLQKAVKKQPDCAVEATK